MDQKVVEYEELLTHNRIWLDRTKGVGVIDGPSALAWALTGPSVILGYLVLAVPILATSTAYSVFLSTPLGREPGGEYAHISRTFHGYGLAFIGSWLKIISYIGALAYLARALADIDPTPVVSLGGTDARLWRYRSDQRRCRPPVLIVHSLVSKSYVLDLLPNTSMIVVNSTMMVPA